MTLFPCRWQQHQNIYNQALSMDILKGEKHSINTRINKVIDSVFTNLPEQIDQMQPNRLVDKMVYLDNNSRYRPIKQNN